MTPQEALSQLKYADKTLRNALFAMIDAGCPKEAVDECQTKLLKMIGNVRAQQEEILSQQIMQSRGSQSGDVQISVPPAKLTTKTKG